MNMGLVKARPWMAHPGHILNVASESIGMALDAHGLLDAPCSRKANQMVQRRNCRPPTAPCYIVPDGDTRTGVVRHKKDHQWHHNIQFPHQESCRDLKEKDEHRRDEGKGGLFLWPTCCCFEEHASTPSHLPALLAKLHYSTSGFRKQPFVLLRPSVAVHL